MAGCITNDFRELIQNGIRYDFNKETMFEIISKIPECSKSVTSGGSSTSKTPGPPGHKRGTPEPWGIPVYYVDSEGKTEEFSSPSALLKKLDLPLSGTVCNAEGEKCRATNAVDILRISGYRVSGDGEPRKKSEGGTKLTVYHPEAETTPKIKVVKRANE